MIKVAIYCRLSDEDKNKLNDYDESESIQNQKSMLLSYAIEKGWALYKLYCDEDYSGIDSTRPEFNQMIKDAEDRKFNIILCKTQSRFTRDMELVEKYIHCKFIEWGIRFVSVVDNADTDVKGNKKARQINGLINEWYLEDASENIRAVFDDKRKKGKHIGSFATYGYEKDPQNRSHFIVDPNASVNVRNIFNMYLNGYSTMEIVRHLNNSGIPSPTKYKWEKGQKIPSNTKTGLWAKDSVLKILRNQMYIGNMVQGYMKKVSYKSDKFIYIPKEQRIIVQNTHEPIIEQDIFWEVQKMLTERRRRTVSTGSPYLFAGKVRCLDCGNTMYKKTYTNVAENAYLRCKLSAVIDRKCTPHSILLKNLINIITEKVREYINAYGNVEQAVESVLQKENTHLKQPLLKKELQQTETSLEQKNVLLKNLYVDKFNGLITEAQFTMLTESITAEQKQLETRIKKLQTQLIQAIINENDQDTKYNIIEKYRDFERLNAQIVRELIDYIEIGEKDRKTGMQTVIIHWLF